MPCDILRTRIVVRLESPVESIENGNQIRDQAFDAAARLVMAVTSHPLSDSFRVSLAADSVEEGRA